MPKSITAPVMLSGLRMVLADGVVSSRMQATHAAETHTGAVSAGANHLVKIPTKCAPAMRMPMASHSSNTRHTKATTRWM